MTAELAPLSLQGLHKHYGGHPALQDFSIELEAGGVLALLGPSGSGKSTLLNLIAGFERPDAGDILIHRRSVLGLPPHQRPVGVVFQQYALFPHLTVAGNVAYPLRRQGRPAPVIEAEVARLLALVHLSDAADRDVRTLSGGQQQRVAIARALAARPQVLLMDEPLGALDRTLREQLLLDLKALLREIGTTVVYVTHDQREALALSSVLAVLRDGRIEQAGPTEAVFAQPRTAFVDRFLSGAQGLRGRLCIDDGRLFVDLGPGRAPGVWHGATPPPAAGTEVEVVVRPAALELRPEARGDSALRTTVSANLFAGDHRALQLTLDGGGVLLAHQPLASSWPEGTQVQIHWSAPAGRLYPLS